MRMGLSGMHVCSEDAADDAGGKAKGAAKDAKGNVKSAADDVKVRTH